MFVSVLDDEQLLFIYTILCHIELLGFLLVDPIVHVLIEFTFSFSPLLLFD